MAIDLNTAEKQRDFSLIPDGTFCKVKIAIDRGNFTLPNMDGLDNGLFKQAKDPSSDAVMLSMRLDVMHGPFTGKPIFENWVVTGGSLDENGISKAGKITKTKVRAAVEAIQNVHPDDQSPAAQQKRILRAFSDLNGQAIPIRVEVQEGTQGYPDNNKIAVVVTPDMPEYLPVMQGQQVDPKPSRRSGAASKPAATTRVAGWAESPMQPAAPVEPAQPGLNLGVDPSWQRSPDGQYAYNGTEWVPAGSPPPPPPPPPSAPMGGNSAAAPTATAPAAAGSPVPAWAAGMPQS
jgi:hypothetical protein